LIIMNVIRPSENSKKFEFSSRCTGWSA